MIAHAKNSLLGAAAGVSITFGSFLSGIVVARLLGVSGAGAYAYAVWIVVMLVPVVDVGLAAAVSRYVPELRGRGDVVQAERLAGYLLRRLALALLIAVLLIGTVGGTTALLHPEWLLRLGVSPANSQSMLLVGLLLLCVVAQVLGSFSYGFLRGAQDFRSVARVAAVSFGVQIVAIAIGSKFFGVFGAIAGYTAGQFVPAFGVFRLIRKSEKLDRELTTRVARYAQFAWAANIANAFVWFRTELFFLEQFWGYDAVAMLTVALALSGLATQGPALLTTGVLSVLAEKRGRNEAAEMSEAYEIGSRMLAAIVFPACFGMGAIIPVLLPLIYGPAFSPAIPAAIVLVCVAAFTVPTIIATNLVQVLERNDFIFFSSAVGAVLAVAAGFLLVPSFGLFGAVMARTAIQILMIALGTWFVTCRLGYRPPFKSLGRLLVAAIASATVAAASVSMIGGIAGLLVAIPSALVVYLIGLRVVRAVTPDDVELLTELARAFPRRWERAAIATIELVSRPVQVSYAARS